MRVKTQLSSWQLFWRIAAVLYVFTLVTYFHYTQSRNMPSTAPCLFRTTTGVPCLMCGATRAFFALSHGRVADAWYYNPLIFPVGFVVGCLVLLWLTEAILGRSIVFVNSKTFHRVLFCPFVLPVLLSMLAILWAWRIMDVLSSGKSELLHKKGLILQYIDRTTSKEN